ncbi:hypothetical protein MPF_0751 [Methanohalophilus portucalensis FDF-1]|uniref:Uncharacterized protein n=1 Tax=Methanohalophilus portucalensis FDF-1 TaxID=523843 RepID=A0A1L9C653_9EURY|nr:hypothetical protein MPF_0751 [Methanohalophilus portucalensis FDF-1]
MTLICVFAPIVLLYDLFHTSIQIKTNPFISIGAKDTI